VANSGHIINLALLVITALNRVIGVKLRLISVAAFMKVAVDKCGSYQLRDSNATFI
jgi:hypothetical protein